MPSEVIEKPIYLDYNASTPVDPAVAAVMHSMLDTAYGNPSSGHWASAPAKTALENARGQVAALLGCATDEIVFTSGGGEANNLALKGVFFARRDRPPHIITSEIEHLNVSFVGHVGAEILARMPAVAASTGSACHSGQITLSPVLEAMAVAPETGMGAIRFSLGRATTEEEIGAVLHALRQVIA